MKSIAILFLFLTLTSLQLRGQVLDQSQPNYNMDFSARHLTGYSVFQYFTAGVTGTLVQINMGFIGGIAGPINGTGSLRIYAGPDTTGGLLQATAVTVVCANGPCLMNFMVSAAVISGQTYTFRFTPGPGIPDPYYLQGENPGTYSGGNIGFINPFNMSNAPLYDLVFRTYVMPDVTKILPHNQIDPQFSVFPNPAKENVTITWQRNNKTAKVTELRITDVSGKTIRQLKIAPGETSIEIHGLEKGVYFITLENSAQRMFTVQKILVN